MQKIQMILDDAVLFEQGYMTVKMSLAALVWTSLDLWKSNLLLLDSCFINCQLLGGENWFDSTALLRARCS